MPDINSRNHFYLGREHDLATGETSAEPLLYKSKDLTTHAVCVGMTGSGKTGLCLSLLEEAAMDGIPAICIDPKGDLGNLMLGFPKLAAEDFEDWVDLSVAQRKGLTKEELAQQTADLWREGLASWDQGPERIQKYNDSVERLIFTPGASHGLPMTVLKSFDAPPQVVIEDDDAFRSRVQSAVSGLLALLDIDADPVRSREHIFLSNVLTTSWRAGKNLSIEDMIGEIQDPPFEKVGVMELEIFFPKKNRTALAMDLNNLLASPSFAGWMTGQPLDVQQLFYSPEGKPRHSIISIAHLDDAQRMFFVTILLNEVLAWMRTQPGTGSLRSLLYMDEVFGYFPPTKNPPSKEPMLTLLKQARAFGLGCVLATQNPVDLDYKGLSNAGTWFLGRLQTERDKMRVMEGLEGASAQAGSTFDKQAMERTLAGVGSRVFLMNSVHEDAPRVFHTRWAMSYLAGPLSRKQIRGQMDPVRKLFSPPDPKPKQDEPDSEKEAESAEEETRKSNEDASEKETTATTPAASLDPALSKKCDAAEQEASDQAAELALGIWSLPFALFGPLICIYDLQQAKKEKKATAKKTSSVTVSLKKLKTDFAKPGKVWAKWRDAFSKHQDLRVRLLDVPRARTPLLPFNAWLAVGFHVVLLMLLVAAAAIAVVYLSKSAMPASPPAANQLVDPQSAEEAGGEASTKEDAGGEQEVVR